MKFVYKWKIQIKIFNGEKIQNKIFENCNRRFLCV